MIEAEDLVKRLKQIKKDRGFTFREMSSDIGVTQDSLMKWWKGSHKPSRMARLLISFYLKKHGKEI